MKTLNVTNAATKAPSNSSIHTNSKLQKDYKTWYKKMKAKLALLEASSSSPHNPKTFQPKNKSLVAKIFDWDGEEFSEDEEVTQVKILKAKAKPFPPCTHCGFNDHGPDDYRNYTECEICRSYDHSTSRHNCVIYIKGGVVPESSLSNESLIRGSTIELHSKLNKTFPSGSVCIFFVWTCLDLKKSQAPEMIMSFVRMVENQNDIKVKQIITNYGIEFRNHELESFYDEKGISQNFSSPYTPEQNGVAEKKNKTLIEAARTMENGSVLSKHFEIKAVKIASDDGYFLGYFSVSKAFKVYNIRRQQIEETYHVTFDESMEAIRFTNTLVDEIGIDDDQRITQPTDVPLGNNTKASRPITEPFIPDVPRSHIPNQASIIYHPAPQDRWSKDQLIKLVNIIGNPSKDMLTRSMAAKLTAALASECLFAEFLSEIEPKKVSEALKHPRWIDTMQEELNYPMCKISVQSKGITSNSCEKNPHVPERKSTLGAYQIQQSVAMSLAEAEYIAVAGCCAMVYQNFLRQFWSTAVAFDPFPSTNEPEKCPLKEFLIKFSVSNGQRPLTLDFKTFCSSTCLDYNNGKYADHPTHEVVKKELGKIATNPSYLDKTQSCKTLFPWLGELCSLL
nr:retrovirus-related Pol polyprotein from transposon TNT 1-94 [Tanacetum cinerariifolium]